MLFDLTTIVMVTQEKSLIIRFNALISFLCNVVQFSDLKIYPLSIDGGYIHIVASIT